MHCHRNTRMRMASGATARARRSSDRFVESLADGSRARASRGDSPARPGAIHPRFVQGEHAADRERRGDPPQGKEIEHRGVVPEAEQRLCAGTGRDLGERVDGRRHRPSRSRTTA